MAVTEFSYVIHTLRAKIHHTDTGYGHHQRTSSQQVVDVVQHVRSRLNLLVQHRPKLHYTDTGYGHVQHHQRTPPTDGLTTILQQICHIAMPEPNISTCPDVGMWQIFVHWW